MLEDTIQWRREFRPDELTADSIRPEVCKGESGECEMTTMIDHYNFII